MVRGVDEWSAPRMSGDGRDIDPALGVLEGEASHQRTGENAAPEAWHVVPGRLYDEPTYYEKPAIKPPDWGWAIPTYFYFGGTGGAAMVMGMAAQLFGGRQLRRFEEYCRWVGAVGGGIGSALLIYDLGRPTRFRYMLRVFRPTSPMSVGSWVLAAATPLSAGSALLTMTKGPLRRLGNLAGLASGVLGLPLAAYTSVLLSNSAVPLWQGTRRTLPVLFTASSAVGMAAVSALLPLSKHEHRITRRFGIVGSAAELAAGFAVEREAARVPRVAGPLHNGASGAMWKAARVLTAAGLGFAILRRPKLAGVFSSLGSLAVRFAVFYGGRASALDPRATFRQQRAGYGGAEVTGYRARAEPQEPRLLPQPRTVEELVRDVA